MTVNQQAPSGLRGDCDHQLRPRLRPAIVCVHCPLLARSDREEWDLPTVPTSFFSFSRSTYVHELQGSYAAITQTHSHTRTWLRRGTVLRTALQRDPPQAVLVLPPPFPPLDLLSGLRAGCHHNPITL